MGKNLFSVPIFFIVFRETLEAAIIVSVLLGLAEQIVHDDPGQSGSSSLRTQVSEKGSSDAAVESVDDKVQRRRLLRKLRFQVQPSLMNNYLRFLTKVCLIVSQIFLGAGLGLFFALAIGAA